MIRKFFSRVFENDNQIWTFYAQLTKLLSGIVFVSVLARSLPSELLALWYIFASVLGLTSLLEMGLSQVIGRHVAYIKADIDMGKVASSDFLHLSGIGERAYAVLWLSVIVISTPIAAEKIDSSTKYLFVSLLLYVVGSAFSIVSGYYAAYINGVGEMWRSQKIMVLSTITSVATLSLFAVFPSSLLIPSAAVFLSQLLMVLMLKRAYSRLDVFHMKTPIGLQRLDPRKSIIGILKDLALMAISILSYQILTNAFFLLISSNVSRKEFASYGLTNQFIVVIITFSTVWSQSKFFDMAVAYRENDIFLLRKTFYNSLIRTVGISFIGILAIFTIAPYFLIILKSKTELLNSSTLMVLLITAWLEFFISQFGVLLIATGKMYIAYISLAASVLIYGGALLMFTSGYSLTEVIGLRAIIFIFSYGLPAFFFSRKTLYSSEKHQMGQK